ncbi:MAG: TldE/PmbA family protein [Betaproteobacteria bacterium]|nr:TldE/PmbA family protein [Betaproteobacteria bacterium]
MEACFHELAAALDRALQPGETYTAYFAAEQSDFVRFNQERVRQPDSVAQAELSIDLIRGRRHATCSLTLGGRAAADLPRLPGALQELRALIADVPEDPFLLYATDVHSSSSKRPGQLPPAERAVDIIATAAAGLDMVGIYAAGRICRGFANSFGQRNWHEVENFNFDWSLYHRSDKAVKSAYAGFAWSDAELGGRMEAARVHLEHLKAAPRTLDPGRYSAYLSPAAMQELLDMLCWGGFSEKQRQVKQSPLQKFYDGQLQLSGMLTMAENAGGGVAPAFQGEGYLKPASLPLIAGGLPGSTMISPRTAQEYALAENGADGDEAPGSIDMAGGALADADVLGALDTGIYIGNLWYCNFSDRMNCRVTGMTRFASFWVEHGRIVAPLNVMRFDDSLFRVLGPNLEALGATPELLIDNHTYDGRGTSSARVPGALIRDFSLTL